MSEQALCVAAAAEQADVDLRQPERGLLGRGEDVARGSKRQTERRAVERTDDGLGAFADRVEALADAPIVLPTLPCGCEPRAAFMSAPAEKTLPAPVRMATRTSLRSLRVSKT